MPESSNIQVISGAGVLLGLGSLLTGNPLIMYAGGCFLGGSIASFTLAGRFEDKLKAELEEANTEHLNVLEVLQAKVSQLEKTIKDKENYLEKLTTANQILKQEKLEAYAIRDSKNEELAQARRQLNDLQIELAQYEQGVKESLEVVPFKALKIVRRTYDKAMKEMKCLTLALSRNYPDCAESLQGFEAEILRLGEKYLEEIVELETISDYQSLLDKGTAITERIIEGGAKLRLRAQNIITRHLEFLMETEYIEVEEAIKISQSLGEEFGQKLAILESEKQQLAEEWVAVSESYELTYQENCSNTEDIAKRCLERMRKLEDELYLANQELAELRQPFQFYGFDSIPKAGNIISTHYFEKHKIILDGLIWQKTENGYTITYGIRRNPGITIEDLKINNSMEMIHSFSNAIPDKPPTWEFDRQLNTVTLTVQTERNQKRQPDIKIKDILTVGNKRSWLITGHPGAGKTSVMIYLGQQLGGIEAQRIALNPHADEQSAYQPYGFVEINDMKEILEHIFRVYQELEMRRQDSQRRFKLVVCVDELGAILDASPNPKDLMTTIRQIAVEGRKLGMIVICGNHSQTCKAIEMDAEFRNSFYQLFLVGAARYAIDQINRTTSLKPYQEQWIRDEAYPALLLANGQYSLVKHPTHGDYEEYKDSGNYPDGLMDWDINEPTLADDISLSKNGFTPEQEARILEMKGASISEIIKTVFGMRHSRSAKYTELKRQVELTLHQNCK